jgi:hypothetical protein
MNKPVPPEGFPRNWVEALFFDGPCAIPLKGNDGWKWYACIDGKFLLRSGEFLLRGGEWRYSSGFGSFEEALEIAKEYQANSAFGHHGGTVTIEGGEA